MEDVVCKHEVIILYCSLMTSAGCFSVFMRKSTLSGKQWTMYAEESILLNLSSVQASKKGSILYKACNSIITPRDFMKIIRYKSV